MKVYSDIDLSSFEFWCGAKNNAAMLTSSELDQIGDILEDTYPEGMSETEVNDLFWFDFAYICEMIGLQYDEEKDEIIRDEEEAA